ncbi:DUF2442 domain-containing protein [Cyclobacterium marinum]|uniref:DUF2442 domain-containing protein n=1 Tax=Cyclobacterium marinum (strain ATCC 25205 / DSM 745 / LMG 13164 / NCIMB 1802) TaxID=880070 RepID=G0IVK0_CYCMS|nr:DUF2442 domain-containing protein [Cyclobacterium marinum]AEL24196.1 Protein of unknown function DUF2442 [Cyclobacterium marinum DSM 745]
MKIIVDYKDSESGVNQLKIDSAKYLWDYAILIVFNDGKERLIDFKPFLSKSLHPSIKKYLDENKFSNFSLIDGNLNWNDYDLIFPISDLHKGQIDTKFTKP